MEKIYKTIDQKCIDKREDELKVKQESGKDLGRLFNMSIALEDNISTKGIKTEAGSKMLKGYIPPFNAEVVNRLLNEDAITKGKIETREFGVGEKIDSELGEVIKRGKADVSIGVDAGGEIRIIASASNLYGLKPTYGSVSRYGIIGSAPSLEQVGIISKDIVTMKLVFESISGKDSKDSTSLVMEKGKETNVKNLKIGILKEYIEAQDEALKEKMEREIEKLKEFGAKIEYISIPSVKYAPSVYNILQSAEFSSDMGKFDGVVYGHRVEEYEDNEDFFRKNRTIGFSETVKKKIMFGNFVLGENNYKDFYDKSQRIRTLITEEVKEQFKKCDMILSPVIGDDITYTVLANLVGCPAISVPSIEGKDFGFQFMGDKFSEETLFQLVKVYEENALNSKEKEGK